VKIIVCVKQVPDTKGGVKFKPDGTLDRNAMLSIMNPDDKAGLEAALRLKDQYGAHVTVLTMGLPKAEDVLREAMAMGADEGVLITDRVLGGADTWATSSTIAAGIRNLDYDLIITGRQAIDGDTAQVGPQIGEKLDCSVVTYLEKLELDGDFAIAVRDIGTGVEKCRAKLPALFTVTEKFGELRPFQMRRVMKYKNAEPETLSCADIGAEDSRCGFAGSPTSVNKIVSVVLAGGDYKEVAATDEGISALVKELVDDHTIG
jgi:electron transfer flavoprotein beta subunit